MMPDCIYFENLCSASVDGTLTRAEKKELEAHLETCPACREYLEDMRVMRTLWRELDDPAPAGLHASIMAAVQADLAQQKEEDNAAAAPADNVVAIPVREKPAPLQAKKRMRSVVLMLGAAAACVALVVSGGLSGGLIGMVGVGQTAYDAAAAAPAAEAPAAMAPQEPMLYAAKNESAAGSARMTEGMLADSAVEEAAVTEYGDEAPAESAAPAAPMLPDPVAERQFAMTYLATGTGELPVIERAVLLTEEGGCSYYSLPNDISLLEDVLDALSGADYTVMITESTTGEGTESNVVEENTSADEILLIIRTE